MLSPQYKNVKILETNTMKLNKFNLTCLNRSLNSTQKVIRFCLYYVTFTYFNGV